MGTIHDLILAHGKQGSLDLNFPREVIEAASAYMAEENGGIGYLYSGWCQAALPHKRLPDDKDWQVKGDTVSLMVQAGARFGPDDEPIRVGVPYGSNARIILFFLQSEALRTGSPEVYLGKSLRDWLERLGLKWGGNTVKAVRDQAERIARCRLSFEVQRGTKIGLINQNIVDTAMFDSQDNPGAFLERARLSDGFFTQLKKHPVPLDENAIRRLSNNSMGLDVYAWLAYRLHALTQPTPVSWKALKGQFGLGVKRMDHFKPTFSSNLQLALAVYPDARLEVSEAGLILHPSQPPVKPRKIGCG